MKVIRNTATLLSNPKLAMDYLDYWGTKLRNSGQAMRTFPDKIKVTGLSGFSEFHSCSKFVSPQERNFLQAYSLNSGALIDVGANLGIVSLILAKRFPERQVHTFEPNPSTFQSLRSNILLNRCDNIKAKQIAIASHDGETTFNADPVNRGTTSISETQGEHVLSVPCITLDTYCESQLLKEVALLKVDVEGYEELVFHGAKNLLSQHRVKVIYYEVCPDNAKRAGLDPEAPTKILLEHGYQIYRINEENSLTLIDMSKTIQVLVENWIAICP